ncbi:carbohydrate-binding module family 13 protein, partial [Candidatus Thiomargarita nelsonii]
VMVGDYPKGCKSPTNESWPLYLKADYTKMDFGFNGNYYYRLTTMWQGDGKSLDIVNDGKNNNRPILATTGNYSGQYWKITQVKPGYYRLTTMWQGDGKSLDIVNDSKNNNRPILAPTGNYSGQYWHTSHNQYIFPNH